MEPTKTKNAIETCAIKNSAYTITLETEEFSLIHYNVLQTDQECVGFNISLLNYPLHSCLYLDMVCNLQQNHE